MKLPDFTNDPALIALRDAMGAAENGSFTTDFKPTALTLAEMESLEAGGIEVTYEEITPLPDGTLAYKDSRILVYIRDVAIYGGKFSTPKFHFSNCRTLVSMWQANRAERYVVATRDDGKFLINKISNNSRKKSWEKLNVCQNCLSALAFDGFKENWHSPRKRQAVEAFVISRFFEQYPKSLLVQKPSHTSLTSPENDYTIDFPQISSRLKQQRAWKCEKCSRDLSLQKWKRFLHVHHKNALKYDNREENLAVLCLECHSKEFQHGQLKGTAEYAEFLREMYGRQ
jgi:hypothetical protein